MLEGKAELHELIGKHFYEPGFLLNKIILLAPACARRYNPLDIPILFRYPLKQA